MDSDKILLKWNNCHQIQSFKFFQSLERNQFCDVTLSASGKFISAHKVILSACSPYLEEMFLLHADKKPIIILDGVVFEDLEAVLEFAYKGKVSVSSENFERFMKAARKLKVKGMDGLKLSPVESTTPPDSPKEPSASPSPVSFAEDSSNDKNPQQEKVKKEKKTPKPKRSSKRKTEFDDEQEEIKPEKVLKTDISDELRLVKLQFDETAPISPNSSACKFCLKQYSRKSVSQHEKSCKTNPDRESHQCTICQKELSRKDKLQLHIRNVHKSPSSI